MEQGFTYRDYLDNPLIAKHLFARAILFEYQQFGGERTKNCL